VKILTLSDTHCQSSEDIPEEILTEAAGCDLIIHAGDFTSWEVYSRLQQCSKLAAVYGNMDSPDLTSLLPACRLLEAEGFSIGITHGRGSSQAALHYAAQAFPEADLIIFGHSHIAWDGEYQGKRLFNPGSPTRPRSGGAGSYGWIEIAEGSLTIKLKEITSIHR